MKRYFIFFIFMLFISPSFCAETHKYPDFSTMFLGVDKFENFNRKVFKLNTNLNKYAIKPSTVVWSSIMPKYGIERIKYMYKNILFPRYLVSSLIQKDFKGAKTASLRFLTNSTIGLGGMFDPAKKFFKLNEINENMEQALAKLNVKQGPYLVVPILNSTTPRGLLGKVLDCGLDPTSYVGTPVIAAVKAGFTINNAVLFQGIIKNILNNYIDPYDVQKKLYGIQIAILNSNLDRKETVEEKSHLLENSVSYENNILNVSEINFEENLLKNTMKGSATTEEILYEDELIPDIILKNFLPTHPIIDAMRTALFEAEEVNKSIWDENSIWNRSFQNKIKTSSIQITENREKYKFKYIMQKDKNAPVAIIFPSVGEGINSHHSTHFAKLLYDEGYSVIIQASIFNYDFYKSMPENYRPGIPAQDVKLLQNTTSKIISYLEEKYECKFKDKIVVGTSLGAMSALYLGDLDLKENLLHLSKIISICPPYDLTYAISEIDKTTEIENQENLKEKITLTSAKIMNGIEEKEEIKTKEVLPFNLEEAKLITGFILHQKLSDLIFAIEKIDPASKSDFYEKMSNINYKKYAEKYLTNEKIPNLEGLSKVSNLENIKTYLENSKNYKIYHSMDDYLVNLEQLKKIRKYSNKKLCLIDKGSHLGFLYREEFINDFKKTISLKNKGNIN